MEQFSLEKYLENPSRKIVTRSGHNVRILCTDQRGNMPIVALVEFETLDGVQLFYHDGKNESHREYDLFFADEEDELTEFDYAVLSIISDHNSHTDSIEAFAKRSSKKLLNLVNKYKFYEQKSEWTEEDKEHIDSIISSLEAYQEQWHDAPAIIEEINSDISWLKSLKQQSKKFICSKEDEEMAKEVMTDIIYAKNDLKNKKCIELSKRAMEAFNWFCKKYKSIYNLN